MDSTVKASATMQNNILLVQYSPAGTGVGDLYAFLFTEPTKPLPFQIQRLTPALRSLRHPIASLSLTTLQFSSPASSSKSLAGDPGDDGLSPADTTPQLLAQNPTDPNVSKSAAVKPAPPFSDLVLSMNRLESQPQVWHLKAPGRGASSDTPPGTGGEPANPSTLPAPLWAESDIPPAFFPTAKVISVGGQRPWSSNSASILTIMMKEDGYYVLSRLVYRRPDSGSPGPPVSSNAWSQDGITVGDWNAKDTTPGYAFHITPVALMSGGGGKTNGFIGRSEPKNNTAVAGLIPD
ncbi:hypothetical protein DFQ27_003605, partial [Actinomortierella ambigua]